MKRVLATFMFFTRLPLWRIASVPSSYFSRVVELWPLAGWLTGGVTALTFYLSSRVLNTEIAIVLALAMRVLLTGGLHEDGYADFCDGFGGGGDKSRILAIMKDSHIGTYGVLGLVLYYLAIFSCWSAMPGDILCLAILAADPWAKFCSSQIINFLPYSRKVEDAKNGVIYSRYGALSWVIAFVIAALPAILLPARLLYAYIAPPVAVVLLMLLMKSKIGGYTGDCCGASFIISELSFYLVITALWN